MRGRAGDPPRAGPPVARPRVRPAGDQPRRAEVGRREPQVEDGARADLWAGGEVAAGGGRASAEEGEREGQRDEEVFEAGHGWVRNDFECDGPAIYIS